MRAAFLSNHFAVVKTRFVYSGLINAAENLRSECYEIKFL